MNLVELSIKILEERLVLYRSLVELLVKTNLSDGSVGKIIELCNLHIVEGSLRISCHNVEDGSDLLLESNHFIHQLSL